MTSPGTHTLGRALRALRRHAHDRPRRHDRERRPPSIQDDLGFTASGLAWVVNAYLIAFGELLLLAGRAGDLLGQRNVFLAGLALFTVASIACAVAQTQGMLIAARFVQGAGGALTSAVVLGMIVTMFPTPREQAKALGVYGFVASAGGSIGLLAGGVLTDALDWHWIFFINAPIGVVTGVLAAAPGAVDPRASACAAAPTCRAPRSSRAA